MGSLSAIGARDHRQYIHDAPANATNAELYGNVVLARRVDTAAAQAGTDGDFTYLSTDNGGNLRVTGPVTATVSNATVASVTVICAGTATIGATMDAGPAWTVVHGLSTVNGAITIHAPFSGTLNTGAVVVTDAPTTASNAGFLVVTDIIASVSAACTLTFAEETTGYTLFGPVHMAANAPIQISPRGAAGAGAGGLHTYTANKRITATASTNATAMIDLWYYSSAT